MFADSSDPKEEPQACERLRVELRGVVAGGGCGATLKQEVRAAAGRGVLTLLDKLILLTHSRHKNMLFPVSIASSMFILKHCDCLSFTGKQENGSDLVSQ